MNNEHNPIAIRIGNIQTLWEKERKKNKQARLFAIVSSSEDYSLIEGFFKLESSPYGSSEDSFVVFFVDFENKATFYSNLIQFWLDTFEEDLKKNLSWNWVDFPILKEEFLKIEENKENELKLFYVKLLNSFRKFEKKSDNLLVVSLIIRKIANPKLLNESIKDLFEVLPQDIALLLYDYKGRKLYDNMIKESNGLIIEVPDQEIASAYKELATQGNPNDPQVKFRKLAFEIGEAAKQRKRKKVIRLGEELIEVGKSTGELSLYASAYLIFSSFLFQFKSEKERIQQLLDNGISIVKPFYKERKDCAGILLQLIMFKAAHYNIVGKTELAIDYFMQNVDYAKELDDKTQVLTGYNYALLVALKKDKKKYKPILEDAFEYGYAMDDEMLKIVNFSLIADNYIKKLEIEKDRKKEIVDRMVNIYGENWQDTPKEIAKKMKEEYEYNNQ